MRLLYEDISEASNSHSLTKLLYKSVRYVSSLLPFTYVSHSLHEGDFTLSYFTTITIPWCVVLPVCKTNVLIFFHFSFQITTQTLFRPLKINN